MDTLIHTLLNVMVGVFLFKFRGDSLIYFILGGILIDIDHLFTGVYKSKTHNIKQVWRWLKSQQLVHQPHFYLLHFYEIWLLILIILPTSHNLYFFSLGVVIHLVYDTIVYSSHYKSPDPWLPYLSLIWRSLQ